MACYALHNICIDGRDLSAIDPVKDDDEMGQSYFNGMSSFAKGILEMI